MTAALGNTAQGTPFATGVDAFVYPQFIGYALRAPTTQDIYNPGTRWQDNSVNPAIIYETTGSGLWFSGEGNHATTTTYGTVLLTDNSEPVATKFYADNLAFLGSPDASTVTKGISYLATNADVVTPYATPLGANTVLVPGNITTIFASPPATGGTSAAAGKFTTLEATGLLTGDAGATLKTAGTALNLGTDSDTAAVNLGTVGARTITIGNITTTTAVAINSGTGGIALVSTGTGDITAASADTLLLDSAGVLELNSSAGVISVGNDVVSQNINVGTGGTRAIVIGNSTSTTSVSLNGGTGSSINIGTNAIQHIVSIGNVTGTTAVAIDSGTGAINIGTSIAKTITIGNITGTTNLVLNAGSGVSSITTTGGTFTLNTGVGAISVSTDASATTLLVGTGGAVKTVTLGSTNGASVTTIDAGSNGLNLGTTGQKTITIGNATGTTNLVLNAGSGASTVTTVGGSLTINTGVGAIGLSTDASATTISIGTGAAVVKTISIGGTGANVVAIANTQTGGSFSIGDAMTTGTISIGGSGLQVGIATLFGGTGAQTINLANNTGVKTINIAGDSATSANIIKIGTGGSTTSTLTMGSTTGGSTTTINGGTGDVKVTGTNLQIATSGKMLKIKSGAATDSCGTAVLTLGTVTVADTNINTGDLIFLSRVATNGSVTLGILTYTIINTTSFAITSVILGTPAATQTADVSSVSYFIVRPI